MTLSHSSYRNFLRSKLVEKQTKNPGYSLRAFARQLGVEAGFLSYVLNGKRDISERMVSQFSEKLQLDEEESQIFELLVRKEKTVSKNLRERLESQLKKSLSSDSNRRDLSLDHFKMISEWYHFAILSLIDLQEFTWTEQNVAESLGVPLETVRLALERLKMLELIEVTSSGRPRRTDACVHVEGTSPNEALRRYHETLLTKNIIALSDVGPQERVTRTQNFAFSSEQLPEVRKSIDQCIRKLESISKGTRVSPEIYHVGFHVFPISRIKNTKGPKK
ncbi:MAG: TIGR02147 family protein [Bdellovibrionales bacterium]|nr:TIGR02147 family protein [Bdellovibrionales bacterium]